MDDFNAEVTVRTAAGLILSFTLTGCETVPTMDLWLSGYSVIEGTDSLPSQGTPLERPFHAYELGDVDGDGREDLVHMATYGDPDYYDGINEGRCEVHHFRSTGISFEYVGVPISYDYGGYYFAGYCGGAIDPEVIDVNGDGVGDLVDNEEFAALSNGQTFELPLRLPGYYHRAVDVTGDGFVDFVNLSTMEVMVSPGTMGFGLPADWDGQADLYDDWVVTTADLTNDGRYDVIIAEEQQLTVLPSLGNAFGPPEPWLEYPSRISSVIPYAFADVTGDGLPDAVENTATGAVVYPNLGNRFDAGSSWSSAEGDLRLPDLAVAPGAGGVAAPSAPGGDGLGDLLTEEGAMFVVLASTGSSFAEVDRFARPTTGEFRTLHGDVTGDGQTDVVYIADDSVWVYSVDANALGTGSVATFSTP